MSNRRIAIIAIAFAPIAAFALHFASENVEIILEGDGYLRVEADYTYLLEGDCNIKIPVLYPVPADSIMGVPDSIAAFYGADTISPPPFASDSASPWATTSFVLPASEECEKTWHIGYRQPISSKHARYIVTTLQLWGRAIDEARFTITYPDSFEDIYISYPPDSREEAESKVIAHYIFENWMPEQDFIIEWK